MNDKSRESDRRDSENSELAPQKKPLAKKSKRIVQIKTEIDRREQKILEGKKRSLFSRRKKSVRKLSKVQPRKASKNLHAIVKIKDSLNDKEYLDNQRENKPEFVLFGVAGLASLFLLFLGASDAVLSEGFFFLFVGLMLLKLPFVYYKSSTVNACLLALIALSLTAFLPTFGAFHPSWRIEAVEFYGLELGWMLSVVPLMSLEGFLLTAATISVFCNMGCWKLNGLGRNRLQYVFAFLTLLLALVTFQYGANPLKAFFSEVTRFTANRDYIENVAWFFVLCGLSSAVLAIRSWKRKSRGLAIGLFGLSIAGVFLIRLTLSVYFFTLISLVFSLVFYDMLKGLGRGHRRIMFVVITAFLSLVALLNISFFIEFFSSVFSDASDRLRAILFSIQSIFKELSFLGYGMATSNYTLPQVNPLHQFSNTMVFHGMNLERFIIEYGILGMLSMFCFSFLSFKNNIRRNKIRRVGFKLLGYSFVGLLLLRFIFSDSQTSIGLVLFFLVYFHLSFTQPSDNRIQVSTSLVRFVGYFWIGVGLIWIYATAFNVPLHSEIRNRIVLTSNAQSMAITNLNKIAKKRNLDLQLLPDLHPAKPYIKAQESLGDEDGLSKYNQKIAQFRFLNGNAVNFDMDLIYLLIERDLATSVQLSYDYFKEEPASKLIEYRSFIALIKNDFETCKQFESVSLLHPKFRIYYLMHLNGFGLEESLLKHPFNKISSIEDTLKYDYIKHLIRNGLFRESDALLARYSNNFSDAWFLSALKEKEMGGFKKALLIIRANVEPAKINYAKSSNIGNHHIRVFLNNSPDDNLGAYLLEKAILAYNFQDALKIVQHILKLEQAPLFAYFWEAELLYRLEDYEESWFSFERYLHTLMIRTLE